MIEEKGVILEGGLCKGPFRALKTRSQPWQGPEEERSRERDSNFQATRPGRSLVGMCKGLNRD